MRLLMLHSGALGDTVLAAQLGAHVRCAHPGSRCVLASHSSIAAWLARRGIIDDAVRWDSSPLVDLFRDTPPAAELTAFLAPFDGVINMLGDAASAPAGRLIEAFSGRAWSLDPRPSAHTLTHGLHITSQWLVSLVAQGLDPPKDEASRNWLVELEGARRCAQARSTFRVPPESKVLVCHPGSGGLAKCCPQAALDALVGLARERAFTPFWMIGPDEVERFGASFRRGLESLAPVLFESDVVVAADLVACADAFVGNDAGMTHVAAIAGIPTVAIFGPTDPRVWRPLGANGVVERFPRSEESTELWADRILRELLRSGPR